MGKDPDQIRREIEDTRDRMGDTVDAMAYRANVPERMKHAVSEKIAGVRHAVTGAVTGAVSGVGGAAGNVADALPDGGDLRSGARRAAGMARENPLGLLLGGAAVGFLVGSLAPATEMENERFGDLGDRVKSQMRETGKTALEHGKAVLRETAEAAQESAAAHGRIVAEETQSTLGVNR